MHLLHWGHIPVWFLCKGVKASHTMAETDQGRMKKYKSIISTVGDKYGIDPAVIAGIISRESRAGNVLHDGWGDYDPKRGAYNAWGLMQVFNKYYCFTLSRVSHYNTITTMFILFYSHFCRLMSILTEVDTLHGARGTVRNISAKAQRSWFISSDGSKRSFLAGARSSSWKVCLTETVDSHVHRMVSHFFSPRLLSFVLLSLQEG